MIGTTHSSTTVCFVLAGGLGRRLSPLTQSTPKPLLSFGGVYSLLDFTLSNVVNSGLDCAYVLTQHLQKDFGSYLQRWNPPAGRNTGFIHQPPVSGKRYRGTADSVAQNMDAVGLDTEAILVLSADHVYAMDYRKMLERHIQGGADVTLAVNGVDAGDASQFGIVSADFTGRIAGFVEKPERLPAPGPGNTHVASMGIYVFRPSALVRVLVELQGLTQELDFGRDLLPHMVRTQRAAAYPVEGNVTRPFYWRDVGTLDSYYDSNMDLLEARPPFRPADPCWPIYASNSPILEWGSLEPDSLPFRGSIVASPLMLEDCSIRGSILAHGVTVGDGAEVIDSVVLPGAHIGRRAAIRNVIVDANTVVDDGDRIGFAPDTQRFGVTRFRDGVVYSRPGRASPTEILVDTGRNRLVRNASPV